MEYLIKGVKLAGGALLSLWLGLHYAIQLLVYLMALDILTGLLAAGIEHSLSSKTGKEGTRKKLLVLLAVLGAEIVGQHIALQFHTPWGQVWGLGAAVACYYAIQEALSVAENLTRAGVPLPSFLVRRLKQLQKYDKKIL
jgi:toxin secretion/phage lysis holin